MRKKKRVQISISDCWKLQGLPNQVSEAVMRHYSKDILLNSKNEYNSNCLTRLTTEENKFEKKPRKDWKLWKKPKRRKHENSSRTERGKMDEKSRKKFLEVPEVRSQGGQQRTRSLPPLP